MHPFQSLKALTSSIIYLSALADMINFQRSLHDCQILKISEIFSQKPSFSKLSVKGGINYTLAALINRFLTEVVIAQ